MPSKFHVIHDFLASSDIGYALTSPTKVSYKSVMQVVDTAQYDKKSRAFTFTSADKTYEITSDVNEETKV